MMAVNVPYCTIRLHRMARDWVARGWEGGTSSRFLTSTRCVLDEAGEAVAVGPVAPVLVKKLRHEKKTPPDTQADMQTRWFVCLLLSCGVKTGKGRVTGDLGVTVYSHGTVYPVHNEYTQRA